MKEPINSILSPKGSEVYGLLKPQQGTWLEYAGTKKTAVWEANGIQTEKYIEYRVTTDIHETIPA